MSFGMSKFGNTHYAVLEIPEGADSRQIREARNRLIREYHPDRIPEHLTRLRKDAQERAAAINEAYRILNNSSERRRYDDTLRHSRATQESRTREHNEEAKREKYSSNSQRTSTPATPSTVDSRDLSTYYLVFGGLAYAGVVWGAWELMDHVARFSFVWWLCILALLAGIPLYMAVAYVAFWLAVAAIAIAIIVSLIQYFFQNPY